VQTSIGPCPPAPSPFGLGAAGTYTVLGLEGANLIISEGATKITGDVGLGKNGTGSLLKATIDGKLFLDPTAHPDIHKDLTVTGGIVIKSMAAETADALAANLALAALPPTQPAIGQITGNTTITGGPGSNVISLAGVNMVKGTLTISGSASSLFIINVTGAFNFSSATMVLTGGVQPNNIIWNFIGPGGDINIFKPGTQAYGTFLAPYRNMIQDHATLNGRYIGATGGLSIKIHSAATVICP
jgi:choice-of-anchor A domain-containing protein